MRAAGRIRAAEVALTQALSLAQQHGLRLEEARAEQERGYLLVESAQDQKWEQGQEDLALAVRRFQECQGASDGEG
jgi:hypothetical protein